MKFHIVDVSMQQRIGSYQAGVTTGTPIGSFCFLPEHGRMEMLSNTLSIVSIFLLDSEIFEITYPMFPP